MKKYVCDICNKPFDRWMTIGADGNWNFQHYGMKVKLPAFAGKFDVCPDCSHRLKRSVLKEIREQESKQGKGVINEN